MTEKEPITILQNARRDAQRIVHALTQGSATSIIALVDALILHAHAADASDIHMLPGRKKISIRFRVDGVLEDAHELPLVIHAELIARLKILSNIRTDEHHAAQDGRFRFTLYRDQSIDVRISLAPTYYGENAVLRLLSLDAHTGSLEQLGFSFAHRILLENALRSTHGMVLATGPTGSGKTTTLYTLITMLSQMNQSIVTIEDPIEYSIDGVSQMAVNPRSGFTFAHGLRSVVRQDPDVIMLGEIRDAETARLACNIALTGHLVLTTLHTSDAATALVRLRDLGVEPYLIASSVTIIIAQRLLRRICARCATMQELHAGEKEALETLANECGIERQEPPRFMRGAGCTACNGTGYRGRIGVYELLPVDDAVREEQHHMQDAHAIAQSAHARGSISLACDALEKAMNGNTTLEEVLKLRHI